MRRAMVRSKHAHTNIHREHKAKHLLDVYRKSFECSSPSSAAHHRERARARRNAARSARAYPRIREFADHPRRFAERSQAGWLRPTDRCVGVRARCTHSTTLNDAYHAPPSRQYHRPAANKPKSPSVRSRAHNTCTHSPGHPAHSRWSQLRHFFFSVAVCVFAWRAAAIRLGFRARERILKISITIAQRTHTHNANARTNTTTSRAAVWIMHNNARRSKDGRNIQSFFIVDFVCVFFLLCLVLVPLKMSLYNFTESVTTVCEDATCDEVIRFKLSRKTSLSTIAGNYVIWMGSSATLLKFLNVTRQNWANYRTTD